MNSSNFTPEERQMIEVNIAAAVQEAEQEITSAANKMVTGAIEQEMRQQVVRDLWRNKSIRPKVAKQLPAPMIDAIVSGAWRRLERVSRQKYTANLPRAFLP